MSDEPQDPPGADEPAPESPEPAESAAPGTAEPAAEGETAKDDPADDYAVKESAAIRQEDVNRQLADMLGRVGGIATGNIASEGQAAIGDGAIAAESILYTTFNVGAKSRSWRGTVPRERLDRLVATYAPGPSQHELAGALALRHVVYLNARPGWGRYAAAQVALAGRHAPDRVVMIHVAPGERIVEAVDEASYAEDHGHVLDASDAHSIGFADLLSVDQHARAKNATVVVIGPLADRGHDLGEYLISHHRPTAAAVFRAQLGYVLRKRGKCVATCAECRLDCVAEYVESCIARHGLLRHLNETLALEEAARTAAVIGKAEPGADLDRLLAGILNPWLRNQARIVLRAAEKEGRADREPWSGTEDYRRAFRLAFAALEGAPMAAVYAAAARLVRIQRAEHSVDAAAPEPVEFELDCLLTYGMQVPGRDLPPVGAPRTAELTNSELVPAMLDVAWNERGLGPRLMRWLHELAGEPQAIVRERAAMMAGLLSFNDFDGVMDGLVAPWARSTRMRFRQAAGLSLLSCAHNPAMHANLRTWVERWLTKASIPTRDAVAWAYAYGLGRRLPFDGLRDLRRIGGDPAQRRSHLVAIGVEQTYHRDHAAAIVGELLDWITDDDKRLQVHSARAFVRLARIETAWDESVWPELLLRRHLGDLAEQQLAEVWHAALCLPSTAASAWQVLTAWWARGEQLPDVTDRMVGLIESLAHDPRLRSRLAYQLDHVWREQRPPSPLLDAVTTIIGRA
jgi:hypothetical protein